MAARRRLLRRARPTTWASTTRRMARARANIAAWSREIDGEGLDAIVDQRLRLRHDGEGLRLHVPHRARAMARAGRAGVGARLRHQRVPDPHRLRADARAARPDRRLSLRLQPAARPAGHGRAEGAAARAPASRWSSRRRRISAAARPAPTTCCSRRSPTRLRERKLGNLRATGADLIAAGNIGCITQLAGGGLPVVHTVELLDWMAGGPVPPTVAPLLATGAGAARS